MRWTYRGITCEAVCVYGPRTYAIFLGHPLTIDCPHARASATGPAPIKANLIKGCRLLPGPGDNELTVSADVCCLDCAIRFAEELASLFAGDP